jgi:hypothetical protein
MLPRQIKIINMKQFALVFLIVGLAACGLLTTKSSSLIRPSSFDDVTIDQFMEANPEPIRQPAQSTPELLDVKPGELFTYIRDPQVLEALENSGFSLPDLMKSVELDVPLGSSDLLSNAELAKNSKFFSGIQKVIAQDLSDLSHQENANQAKAIAGIGMQYSRRIFDARWLTSAKGRFELVGIINRLDRMAFSPKTCGEMRFIYRLAYESESPKPVYSRLPMTLMVKYENAQEGSGIGTWEGWRSCKPSASAWRWPSDSNRWDAATTANWLRATLLNSREVSSQDFKSVEINLQALRIPATVHRALGGNAYYLLRVFHLENGIATPSTLENTPDVDRIKKDPTLLAELKTYLQTSENFHRLSDGILNLPEKFLARKAFSYSPYGTSRTSNRPFDELLKEEDFKSVRFFPNSYVQTPYAAIRRLNDLSCVGCHQGRATAGFHFLGVDRPSTHPLNALFFEGSGHFQSELIRRQKYFDRFTRGFLPAPKRDFSIAPPEGQKAGYGHFCGLTQAGGFSHWQCAAGLECQQSDEMQNEVHLGKCLPKVSLAGDVCMTGRISKNDFNKDSMIFEKSPTACNSGHGGYICQPVIGPPGTRLGGFPSGMCQKRDCHQLKDGQEICGVLAAAGFSDCIANPAKAFTECLQTGSNQGGLGICNETRACRNDYVCARVSGSKKDGACTPSYFLFQVRHDGHPQP